MSDLGRRRGVSTLLTEALSSPFPPRTSTSISSSSDGREGSADAILVKTLNHVAYRVVLLDRLL